VHRLDRPAASFGCGTPEHQPFIILAQSVQTNSAASSCRIVVLHFIWVTVRIYLDL
jgi:hypothetical protein